ncbi:MAG: PRD domain-containing protein, partial [Lactobacillus sp.]|nr:PRD domain-containing protein [Lactobacillus sp.]
MEFVRSLNNSAAIVKDDDAEEIILGKGVGFGLKKGDQIDESKIERRFVTANDQVQPDQVKDLSATTIDVTNKVVKMVEPLLQIKFNDYQYLALADHIDFALTRVTDHIDLSDNNTRWEVKNLFPREYAISEKVVQLINQELSVE